MKTESRSDKAFVGAYVPTESKRRFAALAQSGGVTMTDLLVSMIEKADAICVAMMCLSNARQGNEIDIDEMPIDDAG